MANSFKLNLGVQNIYEGTNARRSVKHKLPEISTALSGKKSAVLSLTGTGASHTLYVTGGVLASSEGDPLNPITGAASALTGNIILGFAIYVTRAVAATAPTGWVELTNTGMCGTAGTYILHEGAIVMHHDPSSDATSNTTGLAFDLSTGTGYRVDVIAWFN